MSNMEDIRQKYIKNIHTYMTLHLVFILNSYRLERVKWEKQLNYFSVYNSNA